LFAVAATALALAGAALASTGKPFETVAQTQTLILKSDWAAKNAITDASCVGLTDPKPRRNPAGQPTFNRFLCHLSGSYFDVQAIVALTGNGGFTALPA
jgi:hypothetical protein